MGSGSLPLLDTLYLSVNQIGADGISAVAVAAGDGALRLVKKLYLSNNQIGDPGMISLVRLQEVSKCDEQEMRYVMAMNYHVDKNVEMLVQKISPQNAPQRRAAPVKSNGTCSLPAHLPALAQPPSRHPVLLTQRTKFSIGNCTVWV